MFNAPPPNHAGITSGKNVSSQPSRKNRIYNGISVTCGGSMMDKSTSINQKLRPKNFNLVNPYAHSDEVISTPGKVVTMMITVFSVQRGKSVP